MYTKDTHTLVSNLKAGETFGMTKLETWEGFLNGKCSSFIMLNFLNVYGIV